MKPVFIVQRFTGGGNTDDWTELGLRPMSRNETMKFDEWKEVVSVVRMSVTNAKISSSDALKLPLIFNDHEDVVIVYMELEV